MPLRFVVGAVVRAGTRNWARWASGGASSPSLSIWRRKKELGKEGLVVAKELKRLRSDPVRLDRFIRFSVSRLLKSDLVAVLAEFQRQNQVFLCMKNLLQNGVVFSRILKSPFSLTGCFHSRPKRFSLRSHSHGLPLSQPRPPSLAARPPSLAARPPTISTRTALSLSRRPIAVCSDLGNAQAEFQKLHQRIDQLERETISATKEIMHQVNGEEHLRLSKDICSQLKLMDSKIKSLKNPKAPPKSKRDNPLDPLQELYGIIRKEIWYRPDMFFYRDMLMMLARNKKVDEAKKVWGDLKAEKVLFDQHTFGDIIRAFLHNGLPSEAMEIYEEMRQSPDPPLSLPFRVILKGLIPYPELREQVKDDFLELFPGMIIYDPPEDLFEDNEQYKDSDDNNRII